MFAYLKPYLNEGGVVFGSTILGSGIDRNPPGRWLMATYNRKGIFHNTEDSLDQLEACLNQHFSEVNLRVVGCVAVFSARY